MFNRTRVFKKAVLLIREGKSDEACRLVFDIVEKSMIEYLKFYNWTIEEARQIFHDAYLLIELKIKNGEIDSFNKTYIKKICKNIGANSFRKCIVRKREFEKYLSKVREDFNQEMIECYGVNLYSEEDCSIDYQRALRAFDLLGDKCKQIIKMKHVDGISHTEIAKSIDEINSEYSSKTILSRCLKKWRHILNELR